MSQAIALILRRHQTLNELRKLSSVKFNTPSRQQMLLKTAGWDPRTWRMSAAKRALKDLAPYALTAASFTPLGRAAKGASWLWKGRRLRRGAQKAAETYRSLRGPTRMRSGGRIRLSRAERGRPWPRSGSAGAPQRPTGVPPRPLSRGEHAAFQASSGVRTTLPLAARRRAARAARAARRAALPEPVRAARRAMRKANLRYRTHQLQRPGKGLIGRALQRRRAAKFRHKADQYHRAQIDPNKTEQILPGVRLLTTRGGPQSLDILGHRVGEAQVKAVVDAAEGAATGFLGNVAAAGGAKSGIGGAVKKYLPGVAGTAGLMSLPTLFGAATKGTPQATKQVTRAARVQKQQATGETARQRRNYNTGSFF